ncbi:MAG: sulfatase-like hydrolase/transferase, partial [Bacteroidaceae bacterium]
MKNKVIQFVKTYLLFILIFLVQKPLFMFYYHDIYENATFVDYLLVMWNGLKLDASMAGYLTAIPGFILILSLWLKSSLIQLIQKVYFYIIAFALSLISVADLGLYRYWGFRLDSSPLFYLSSPKSAFASADWWLIVAGLLLVILSVALLCFLFNYILIGTKKAKLPFHPIPTAGCLLLLTALLFIPIRGGFTVSTMNTGKVYFSPRMELNHAAINPCFSLMESLSREQNFADQYRFMDADVALEEFNQLIDKPVTDSIPSLFTTKRPNVILVVLESFMSKVIEPLGGLPDVARRLNGFSQEGVLFTNFYANSFRTDRGLVSIIGGYPAQPTTSIMKYPRKTQHLPSIPASLKKAGYELQYYYGGDADFTNMRSFLMACGIENIISDVDFPLKERQSKWGALDEIVFSRLANDLKQQQKEPFMKILQTSSSHEPFKVPYHRLSDLYLNSVAYTDSCLGNFIDQFKQTKYWDNTVIVFVPDHA